MELSKEQKMLLELLQSLSMEDDLIIPIMIAVKEPEKTYKLLEYVANMTNKGKTITKKGITIRALEISQEDLEEEEN